MAQIYNVAPDLEQIAKVVLKKYSELEGLRESDCRIGYQWSDGNRKKGEADVYADTTKVNTKVKEFSECDFVITFYDICRELETWQLERIMFHELLHVGYSGSGECKVNNHDIEDFRLCISKWGMEWLWKQEETEEEEEVEE